uniref:Thyroglobulin type-1 domain-containing protein n=1 Tax=Sinocyclocheilus grahami TaxID=75366 RepID=A0A672JXK5_SINGR
AFGQLWSSSVIARAGASKCQRHPGRGPPRDVSLWRKFLKNAGNFNFTGTVGNSGTLSFSQVGLTQAATDLMQLAKTFTDDSASFNLDQEISDTFGRSVNLKNNRDMIKLVSMALENEQFLTVLREAIKQLKAEESTQLGQLFHAILQKSDVCKPVTSTSTPYVPQCTEDGQYQEVQCQGSECWCVDSRGLEIIGSRITGHFTLLRWNHINSDYSNLKCKS